MSVNPDWRAIAIENPGLVVQSAALLGEGWNSRVFLVNDELVFRFPKRRENWEELKREIAFLEFAADHLPLAVPRYIRVVPDSLAAPHGYAVYRYLAGHRIDASVLTLEQRAATADAIAALLRALHGLEPNGGLASLLPREDQYTVAEEYLARTEQEIIPKLPPSEGRAVRRLLQMHLNTPANFSFRPVVLHADLGGDHLLMEGGAVAAAIDFGDVNWGDPDYDFMYLFVDFGQEFAEEVARRYGHQNLEQLRSKLRYFATVDQIGTILDGPGRALAGHVDAAWHRLKQLLGSRESGA